MFDFDAFDAIIDDALAAGPSKLVEIRFPCVDNDGVLVPTKDLPTVTSAYPRPYDLSQLMDDDDDYEPYAVAI